MTTISCSDIAVTCSIISFIEIGRLGDVMDCTEALSMMCFFADNISLGSCTIFYSASDLLIQLKKRCSESSSFYKLFCETLNMSSVDDMIDIMNNGRDCFNTISSTNPNGACVPFMIKQDSLVGLFMRRVLVKWEILSYAEISQLFSCFHTTFLTHIEKAVNIAYLRNDERFSCATISTVERAVLSADLFPALEGIHSYFDHSGQNPLRTKSDALTSSIESLDSFMQGFPNPKTRHQQAMLSLANMWVRGGHFGQASIATEEGMKMSHQLGDHASVARALLLLYYVVEGQENGQGYNHVDALQLTAEGVLIRCIQRCVELNMRPLEVQATLLLVRLRTRLPLHASVTPRLGYVTSMYETGFSPTLGDICHESSATQRSQLAPHALWTLLLATHLDMSLHRFSGAHAVQTSNSTQPNQKSKIPDATQSIGEEYTLQRMNRLGHAALVECELWFRLGVASMAALSLRRVLRQASPFVGFDIVMRLCLRLAEIMSLIGRDGALISSAECLGGFESNDMISRSNLSNVGLEIIARIKSEFDRSAASSSHALPLLRYTDLVVRVRRVLLNTSTEPISEASMRHIANECLVLCDTARDTNLPPEYLLQARILQCAITSYFDIDGALKEAAEIYNDACRVGYSMWKGEARVLMAALRLRSAKYSDMPTIACVIQSLMDISRAEYVPFVEASLVILVSRLRDLIQQVRVR